MQNSKKIKAKFQIIGNVALISVFLIFSGYYYYQKEKDHHKGEKFNELYATGNLKAEQLSFWISERIDEATFFSSQPPYPHYIKDIISENEEIEYDYKSILSLIVSTNRFENIYILDRSGNLAFSVNSDFDKVDSITTGYASQVMETGKIAIKDFYYCPTHEKIHFEIFAPVMDENFHLIAIAVFRINPDNYIYPFLTKNTTPNWSKESYLIKKEGDSVSFISPLRHLDNSKLQISIPVSKTEITAVHAVSGKEGRLEGIDYRGERVFADIQSMPNTDWYILTEIDHDELFVEFNKLAIWLFSAIAFFILLIAALVSWIYQRRQRNFYQELLDKRTKLFRAQEEYGATLYSIGDGVITTDQNGKVRHLNPVAEKLTGWKESEAINKPIEDVFVIRNETTREIVQNPVQNVLQSGRIVGLANHTILISKDGHETPISDSGAPIKDKTGNLMGVIMVFSDQTEERLRQKLIEIRLRIFEYAIDHPLKETLVSMMDEICLLLKSPIGFLHLIEPDREKLWLQIWSSNTQKEFCNAKDSGTHFDLDEAGIWADAVRQKQPVIHNDYGSLQNKKGTPEGHAALIRELIVPVIRKDRVVAVMGIGNKPTNYQEKDVEILSFLADISWEISEHKLNEDRLRQSEERFVQLFERAPLSYQSLDENGHIIEINQAWTETLGYSKEEVIGKWFGEFIAPIDLENFKKRFSDFKVKGKTHSEMIMKHKNGTERLIVLEGNAGFRDDGSFEKTHCILRDVTESRQLEKKLEENERQLSSMVGNLPGFVYRCKNDKDWTMLYLSRQFRTITGYAPEDFLYNKKFTFNAIIKKEYQSLLRREWNKVLSEKSFFRMEYEVIAANKEVKWVLEQGVGVYDSSGELLFLEGYIEDITDRKVFELQLIESEEKFKNLFHEHSAAKLIIDPDDGRIVDANEAAAHFYGWSIQELSNMNMAQLNVLPAEKVLQIIKSAVRIDNAHFEFQHRKASGEIVEVENFNSKVNINGRTYLHAIIHDISDRKRIEKALRESEEKNRLIMDNSMDAILLTKPDGSVISANHAACKMFGMTEKEICSAGRSGLVDLNDPRLPKLLLQREKYGFAEGELDFFKKDGTKITTEIASSVFQNSKGEFFTSMIIRDITERKRWEEDLLIAKEKAEISDKLKSAFLANMSHEIRTPMNGILGFLGLLKSKDLDDQSREEFVELVNKSGQRLLDTINDIIEISKIEAGEYDIKKSQVNVSEIMQYHLDFFSLQAKEKGIELILSEQVPSKYNFIETDRNKLSSILTNLIKNAIKFTTHGSIRLGNYLDGNSLVFYIRDTGCGIPAEKIESVFERFIQADPAISRPYEGSGLGLTIAKANVNLLGGKIWVESEVKKGSTFYFSIPLHRKTKKSIKGKSQRLLTTKFSNEMTILIAEDDDTSYKYLEVVLKKKNIKTVRAVNGQDAFKVFMQNPNISLILMDIKMPVMDGFEATKEIRKFNKAIPIIAQTAYALSEDKEKAKEAGCNDYLVKPIKPNELFSILYKYLA